MHFRIKKCDIFIDYAFILVLSLAAVFNSKQVIYLLLFSALHEIGHLTALLICKEKPYKIHLSYYGFAIRYTDDLPRFKECIVLLCGPLVNLVLYLFFKDKKYSNTLQIIGIVPIVEPQEIVEGENYKEKVKFLCNKSVASINIKMDFNDYYNADSIKRIELTKEMILTAVKRIITKVDFDYGKFKEDLISLH